MTADHEAWAIVGGTMHGRALLVTKGNSFLEYALRLQPNIDLFETTPNKYANANVGDFDLIVFDGYVPATLPASSIFFINPPTGSYLFGKSGPEISVNHISAGDDSQNLLSQVDLNSIHVLRVSHLLTGAPWAQPVIITPQTPLLIAGENANRRIAALSFDIHDSDLPLQPSFPILIYNLVNWFLPPPVPGDGQVAPDTPVTIQPWPGADRITITAPGQQAVTVAPPFPVATFNRTNQPGLYSVTQHVHDQVRNGAFAVNLFDPGQSSLAPASRLPIANSTSFDQGGPTVPRVLREIWPWIAAFLLLVLCAEWLLFSRSYILRKAPSRDTTMLDHSGQRLNGNLQHNSPGAIRSIQQQVEKRYRVALKRVTKATKRLRGQLKRQKVKGKRNASF